MFLRSYLPVNVLGGLFVSNGKYFYYLNLSKIFANLDFCEIYAKIIWHNLKIVICHCHNIPKTIFLKIFCRSLWSSAETLAKVHRLNERTVTESLENEIAALASSYD